MSSDSTAMSTPESQTALDRPRFVDPEAVFDESQDILGRKWHLPVVYQLLEDGPMGFSALKRQTAGISSKMLSESLDSLESAGVVERTVLSEQPVRVEYALTERGLALETVVNALLQWGNEFGTEKEAT